MSEFDQLSQSLQRNRVTRRQVLWLFGAGAVSAVDSGISTSGHFSLLGALLIATALTAPLATAFALRIALE